MKIIAPFEVTTERLQASNVSIDETEWTAGTYSQGDRRYVGTTLYEVVASSTDDEPTEGINADPPTWIRVGAINRFKMFDGVIDDQTANAETVSVTIEGQGVSDGIALFNINGIEATIRYTDSIDGLVYDQTFSLQDDSAVVDWFNYYFAPIEQMRELIVTGLPTNVNPEIEVILDAGSGEARIGELMIGRVQPLGVTNYRTQIGIIDYSRKEADDFGNRQIVERRFSKTADYVVTVETDNLAFVQRVLADRRAKLTVYIGDEDRPETVVAGFYRDFRILMIAPTISDLSLEVEGLT